MNCTWRIKVSADGVESDAIDFEFRMMSRALKNAKSTVRHLLKILLHDPIVLSLELEGPCSENQGKEPFGMFFLTPAEYKEMCPLGRSPPKFVVRQFSISPGEEDAYARLGLSFVACHCGIDDKGDPKNLTTVDLWQESNAKT